MRLKRSNISVIWDYEEGNKKNTGTEKKIEEIRSKTKIDKECKE